MKFLIKWIFKQSIEKKLILSNLIGLFLAFIFVILILLTYEYFALRNHVLQEIRIEATIVGESAAAAMAFRDEEAAFETLSILKNATDVLEAYLVLADGTILQSYIRNSDSSFTPIKASIFEIETFTLSTVTIEKPIYLRKQFIGSIVLVNSLNNFYNRLMLYSSIIVLAATVGFLLARWIAIRISLMITKPLISLTSITQKIMKDEDYTIPILINSKDEIGSLARSFRQMMFQIRLKDAKLKKLAYFDRVTNIPNRHYFEECINLMIENAKKYKTHCHLMMIDLDDFKIVNDTLGHHIGDILLKHVSEQLSKNLRQDDTIFRIGGDEFAVLFDNIYDESAVIEVAKKIIKAISSPVILEGNEVKIGASIGIGSFPQFASDVKTLMITADSAMYIAKKQGKNSYKLYQGKF